MKARWALVGALVVGIALPGAYLALGGGSSDDPAFGDPCASRQWTNPDGLEETAQQVVLSALDGAACDVGVPREELVLALASESSRAAFATKYRLDTDELDRATRRGLERSISDAERAGAIDGLPAEILRQAAQSVTFKNVLDLVDLLG